MSSRSDSPSTETIRFSTDRRHDLDALRASAMFLGIIYHVSLSFALGMPWLVQDSQQSKGMFWFQAGVHGFRMPLFFLISGFFTAMLWRSKGLKALLWHRFRRVLIPCLLALFTVVPAMGWSIGIAFEWGMPKMWRAIQRADTATVNQELLEGFNVESMHPGFGTTPLTWAAVHGNIEAMNALVKKGAVVDGRNFDGGTPLHAASFLGKADVAEWLIAHGADIQLKNYQGETALHNAGVDYGIVEYIAGQLNLKVKREEVERGRALIVARLKELGASVEKEETPPATKPARSAPSLNDLWLWLVYNPTFTLVWFLWFLWWMVVVFAFYALLSNALGWHFKSHWLILSNANLLYLVPITMIPQWFMGSQAWEFGPDTSMGLVPMPHVFLFYCLFFGFGVIYFDCNDEEGKLGKGWRWSLPFTLLVVFVMGLEFATGTFGFRDLLLPRSWHRLASVFFQSTYAWMMTFACMGMFRSLLTRENRAIRYLSDSSYWLYLTHLPLAIIAQAYVKAWNVPAIVKLSLISVLLTLFLLLTYALLVRHTWIGWLLNGPRRRHRQATNATRI